MKNRWEGRKVKEERRDGRVGEGTGEMGVAVGEGRVRGAGYGEREREMEEAAAPSMSSAAKVSGFLPATLTLLVFATRPREGRSYAIAKTQYLLNILNS